MSTISSLFGRTPFAPLESHMRCVTSCVLLIKDLFAAIEAKNWEELERIAEKIYELEHAADKAKNDIRNHLPTSLFMPIDRGSLLEILTLQDSLADRAEDLAVLATMKHPEMPEEWKELFKKFLDKNLEAFEGARKIIKEMHELLESSFGGAEAERVRKMVHDVSYNEHEADLIQRELMKLLVNSENQITFTSFFIWQKLFETLGNIANLSENLAYRVRMTLELK